jgi:hypothetical protein
MEKKKPTIKNYPNATYVKLENKRVGVEDLPNNDIGIVFKRICTKEDAAIPAALNTVVKGVIKKTTIRLSNEAAFSLLMALAERFKTRCELSKPNPDATKS